MNASGVWPRGLFNLLHPGDEHFFIPGLDHRRGLGFFLVTLLFATSITMAALHFCGLRRRNGLLLDLKPLMYWLFRSTEISAVENSPNVAIGTGSAEAGQL
jgi:hypothetical protein